MEWFWLIFWALVAGLIIGPLARLVIPGKQDIGVFPTILAGAVGALVGGLIAQALGDPRAQEQLDRQKEIEAAIEQLRRAVSSLEENEAREDSESGLRGSRQSRDAGGAG